MRKRRSIIALGVALILLVGVYIFLSTRPKAVVPDDTAPTVDISKVDKATIVNIALTNESGEIIFEKNDEGWTSTKPYPVKLAQSTVDDLSRSFTALTADVVVEEEPSDLSIYGLKDPVVKGEAELKDGTKVVLNLGNKTAEGSTYYLMKEGDPKVYTVWSSYGQKLSSSLSDFRDKTLTQINLAEMSYLYMAKEGQKEIEIVTSEEQTEDQVQYRLGLYEMVKPYKQPRGIDSTKLDEKLKGLPNLVIKDFADDNPTDLSVYGLDKPVMQFIIKDSANTLDLAFGNTLDDGTIYFKTADSDAVYTMDKAQLDFMNTKPMEIMERFSYIVNIDSVDKVVIEGKGKTHTLTMTRATEKAAKEGEKDKVITTYFLDGEEKKEDAFKDFYQSLIGTYVDTDKTHEPQGEAEVKLTYYLNRGAERKVIVEYVPYDRDFYSLVLKGESESEFLVARNRIDWVFEDLDVLIASKLEK